MRCIVTGLVWQKARSHLATEITTIIVTATKQKHRSPNRPQQGHVYRRQQSSMAALMKPKSIDPIEVVCSYVLTPQGGDLGSREAMPRAELAL